LKTWKGITKIDKEDCFTNTSIAANEVLNDNWSTVFNQAMQFSGKKTKNKETSTSSVYSK